MARSNDGALASFRRLRMLDRWVASPTAPRSAGTIVFLLGSRGAVLLQLPARQKKCVRGPAVRDPPATETIAPRAHVRASRGDPFPQIAGPARPQCPPDKAVPLLRRVVRARPSFVSIHRHGCRSARRGSGWGFARPHIVVNAARRRGAPKGLEGVNGPRRVSVVDRKQDVAGAGVPGSPQPPLGAADQPAAAQRDARLSEHGRSTRPGRIGLPPRRARQGSCAR